MKINLCVLGCPLPPYIKDPRGVRPSLEEARRRSPTPTRSRTPLPFLVQLGEVDGEKERGGASPPSLSNSD